MSETSVYCFIKKDEQIYFSETKERRTMHAEMSYNS